METKRGRENRKSEREINRDRRVDKENVNDRQSEKVTEKGWSILIRTKKMEQSREKQKVTEKTKTMNTKEKETDAEKERNE